jgi:hypothetical protein
MITMIGILGHSDVIIHSTLGSLCSYMWVLMFKIATLYNSEPSNDDDESIWQKKKTTVNISIGPETTIWESIASRRLNEPDICDQEIKTYLVIIFPSRQVRI